MSGKASVVTPAFPSLKMQDRLIVALDVPKAEDARTLLRRLGESVGTYKVGLQLFTAEGPDLIRELVHSGKRVFLDLKLHDIPNTVSHAVKAAAELGAGMLTVHASGGTAVLRAAVEAAEGRLTVLGVTVLTSLNDQDLSEIGFTCRSTEQALRLATLAQNAGCGGVVASPLEARHLRESLGDGLTIVTPGVRPEGAGRNDQQRTASPGEAIANGASYIVVGRPITHAPDPAQAARAIIAEMEQGGNQ
jgi:orotidine-5'-phosphate decarboxylase